MVFVLKHDGTFEPFDRQKLRACLLRVLPAPREDFHFAEALSIAIRCYLRGRRIRCLSSAAVLEMALTVLRAVGLTGAAAELESQHAARLQGRSRLTIHHNDGRRTAWSKEWLARQAASRWGLGRTAARILAGQIERELIRQDVRDVGRAELMQMLAVNAAAYGLAGPGQRQAISRSR
jgi:hypothetical protein